MSLRSDFDLVWKSYEDKLSSYLAQNSMKNKLTHAEELNAHYQRTVRMWDDESKAQGGFVSKWEKEMPGFRKEFMSVLNEHTFQNSESQILPSPIPYVGMTAVLTAVGGIVGYLIPGNFFLKKMLGNVPVMMIAMIVFASTGGGFVKALYGNSVAKKCTQCAESFYLQIESLRTKLETLCTRH